VPGRLLPPAHRPEGVGQPFAGTHVWAGLQQTPEVPHVFLEGVGPDRPLPGGHRLLVQPEGLLAAPCLLGEQDVGVGAVRRDREGLPGDLGPTPGVVLFEGLVQDLLRLAQRGLLDGPRQLAHEIPHDPFQGAAVGDDEGRLGLSLRPARSLRAALGWLLRAFLGRAAFLGHRAGLRSSLGGGGRKAEHHDSRGGRRATRPGLPANRPPRAARSRSEVTGYPECIF
jgi:hypothetical protein